MAAEVCGPWITPDDLCCEGGGDVTNCDGSVAPLVYPYTDEDYILAASNILYAKTCYLYPGVCTDTVWPCISCGCQRHPCACGHYSAFELPTDYDVISIEEIRIDGVPLDPLAYRLERVNVVVRIDGLNWPRNSFGLPGSDAPVVEVDYTFGRVPPIELQLAVGELACELKRACNGQACGLNRYVTEIVRRGTTTTMMDITDMMKTGATGLPMVDHAISIHTPCSHDSFMDPAKIYRGWSVS